MAQLQKGTNYTATGDNSFVTHTNLNAHVTNAKLIGGAIGEQIANNVSEDADLILIKKGDDLFKQTKAEFLNTINTGSVNANTVNAEDIVVDDVIINDTVEVGGNATIDGTLEVTGATTLTGGVAGNLAVSGYITSAIAPTAGDQLANKTYVDGASLLAQNGYFKLPNGLIFQWGRGALGGTYAQQTIFFPIPFPNNVFHVQVSGSSTIANYVSENNWKWLDDGSTTLAKFNCLCYYTGSASSSNKPMFFAIGN
jgi:hypothetical protein